MKKKLILSLLITTAALFASYYVARPWIDEVNEVLGSFLTWSFMFGVVFLPCYGTFYLASSLLWKVKPNTLKTYPGITVLIAAYNEEECIERTIDSINNGDYYGEISIVVVDDGSIDNTGSILKSIGYDNVITITQTNTGKAGALNHGIKHVNTDIFVTVDADTLLHESALTNIVATHVNNCYDATAGAIRVQNPHTSLFTKIQNWDYMIGLAAAKQAQGTHDGILVAQGAFSCFYTYAVLSVGGWPAEDVGEDIVLSWAMNKKGMTIGYAPFAVCFTDMPETYKEFFAQRKRWSRGLIEAFRRHSSVLITPSRNLPFYWYNIFFPIMDVAFALGFVPAVIAALFFGNSLLAGYLTLFLIPLGLTLMLLTYSKQMQVNKYLGLGWNGGGIISFVMFVLFFQVIQTPATLSGYISELFKAKKNW